MDIKEVKKNLNKIVVLNNKMYGTCIRYKFSGCILRKKESNNEYYYQTELQDLEANCIVYSDLESIEVII